MTAGTVLTVLIISLVMVSVMSGTRTVRTGSCLAEMLRRMIITDSIVILIGTETVLIAIVTDVVLVGIHIMDVGTMSCGKSSCGADGKCQRGCK